MKSKHHKGALQLAASASVLMCLVGVHPAQASTSLLTPAAGYLQAGTTGDTHAVTFGITWNWSRQWELGSGQVTGYWDASLSRWSYPSPEGRRAAWLSQIGIKPVLRWSPSTQQVPWFLEAGIGLSFTNAVYETDRRRFSITFNFGDHIAIGRSFGPASEHEVSLRIEHFSNAGIRHPNPGADFLQLRYVKRL
jgi:lipid A 3-O-deacylase